jgi:hypothetical protein
VGEIRGREWRSRKRLEILEISHVTKHVVSSVAMGRGLGRGVCMGYCAHTFGMRVVGTVLENGLVTQRLPFIVMGAAP